MKNFINTRTLMGVVVTSLTEEVIAAGHANDPRQDPNWFVIETASGDQVTIHTSTETYFTVITNIDGLSRDRVPTPPVVAGEAFNPAMLSHQIFKYVLPESLIVIRGVYQEDEDKIRFDARTVYLLDSHNRKESFQFETDDWWQIQIRELANGWLDSIFGSRRNYSEADFAELYTTNLNILGMPTGDRIQEMATLSRLIYGLSSAYLLTGQERFLEAAAAGVKYQREAFRFLCHGGSMCIWAFGRKAVGGNLTKVVYPSQNSDDFNQFPLYEQIYALAGLTQYFRITNDAHALADIQRTIKAINYFFRDPEDDVYFSHIDYVERRPGAEVLGENRSRKNWNSIGDHLPAYLINLLLAIDPLPQLTNEQQLFEIDLEELVSECHRMVRATSGVIVDKFPARDGSHYVNERYFADLTPDHTHGWQMDRGIVGHNLKISWNLTRVANYHLRQNDPKAARQAMRVAEDIANAMAIYGLDRHRGGCFDAMERHPKNGMPTEIAWLPTKDFWQQEQGILAYLILYGHTRRLEYLQLTREMQAFWNLFFLDRDRWGIFFRVTEDGLPYIEGAYGDKGGHSVSGYHSFELNYLVHIYSRIYLSDASDTARHFSLYFRPSATPIGRSINVLPDFFPPNSLEILSVTVNGVPRHVSRDAKESFQIPLLPEDAGKEVAIVFRSSISKWMSTEPPEAVVDEGPEVFVAKGTKGVELQKRRLVPKDLPIPDRAAIPGVQAESEVF